MTFYVQIFAARGRIVCETVKSSHCGLITESGMRSGSRAGLDIVLSATRGRPALLHRKTKLLLHRLRLSASVSAKHKLATCLCSILVWLFTNWSNFDLACNILVAAGKDLNRVMLSLHDMTNSLCMIDVGLGFVYRREDYGGFCRLQAQSWNRISDFNNRIIRYSLYVYTMYTRFQF